MKQTITAKLKLQTAPTQFAALRETQLAYRDALNQRASLQLCTCQDQQSARLAAGVLR
jgi:hypothetical protein